MICSYLYAYKLVKSERESEGEYMSGGRFLGREIELEMLREELSSLKREGGYSKDTYTWFSICINMLNRCSTLIKDIDYLVCGDISEEEFQKRMEERKGK